MSWEAGSPVIFLISEPWYWKMQTIGMQMMGPSVDNSVNFRSQRMGRRIHMKGNAVPVMRQNTRCVSLNSVVLYDV
jgi:hypothetical protein